MEDLDAELLAVTDGKKRSSNRGGNDASDSGAEFDGIADSDQEDDNDYRNGNGRADDDDDDDDDEYGLDDDEDEQYSSKRRPKKKESRQSKKKTSRPKQKSEKRSNAKTKRENRSPMDEDDEEQFEYEYDHRGYGDAADHDRLAKMNEVERELLLEDRIEARTKAHMLWKKRKEMMAREEDREDAQKAKRIGRSSGRSKPSSKSDALQALAEDRRKKSSRAIDIDVSDADSEADRPNRRDRRKEEPEKAKAKYEDATMDPDEGPELRYADLVTVSKDGVASTSPLFLRRDALVKLSQKAYFERVVMGLFARVRALGGAGADDTYVLCRVVGAVTGKVYDLGGGYRSNWHLTLQSGKQRRNFMIPLTSGSHPTEREFKSYCDRSMRYDVEVPRREEVESLLRRAKDMIVDRKVRPTDSEEKKYRANREIVYPERVKWTQKLAEAQTALEIKMEELKAARDRDRKGEVSKLEHEVRELQERVDEVQEKEDKYVLKAVKNNAEVFQNLAKRNDALNSATERLAATKRTLDANNHTSNPFARVDTTGKSYFTINAEQEEADEKREKNVGSDWKTSLSIWEPNMKKRKIGENATDEFYNVPLPALDIFKKSDEEISSIQDVVWSSDVDAVYAKAAYMAPDLPLASKEISLEEWNRQRGG